MSVFRFAEPDDAAAKYRLDRSILGPRFLDPAVEREARAELAFVGIRALRFCCRAMAALAAFSLVWAVLPALRWPEATAQTHGLGVLFALIAVILGIAVAFLVVIPRLAPRHHFAAAFAFAAIVLLSVAVLWPVVFANAISLPFVQSYGYFGPVVAAMLPLLMLRLPCRIGYVLNLLAVVAYAITTAFLFPTLLGHWLIHVHNVAVGALAACAGGWMLEVTTRENFAKTQIIALREAELAVQHARAEKLLLNILPAPIAARLEADESPIADAAEAVTVVFADLVGFTPLAAKLPPADVVRLLDEIFRRFDACADEAGVEKIKTIGDAYLAVAGLPAPRADHAAAGARFALAIRAALAEQNAAHGTTLALRIGIESGPVVAGVIGQHKFSYDLWGDTVNAASRMESHGEPGRIHLGAAAAALLAGGELRLEPRGEIEVKGKGRMRTSWLE